MAWKPVGAPQMHLPSKPHTRPGQASRFPVSRAWIRCVQRLSRGGQSPHGVQEVGSTLDKPMFRLWRSQDGQKASVAHLGCHQGSLLSKHATICKGGPRPFSSPGLWVCCLEQHPCCFQSLVLQGTLATLPLLLSPGFLPARSSGARNWQGDRSCPGNPQLLMNQLTAPTTEGLWPSCLTPGHA